MSHMRFRSTMQRSFTPVVFAASIIFLSPQPLLAAAQEFAHTFKDEGDGSAGDPWVGWEDALAADREVIFIKGYFQTDDEAIALPSNIVLTGVDGAILKWPGTRVTVEDMLSIPAGTENVVIRGLQFEPGVTVPLEGLSSGGGAGYIGIGTVDDNDDPVSYVLIQNNRFGVARYGQTNGNHIRLHSSINDLTIRENFMDSAPTNVRIVRGSDVEPGPTYNRIRFEDNVVWHSQAYEDFGAVISSPQSTVFDYWGSFADFSVVGNVIHNHNGTFGIDMAGTGLNISNNTAKSNNMDLFITIGHHYSDPGRIRGFVISNNTCYADDPTGNPDLIVNPSCVCKFDYAEGGVVVGNTLRRGGMLLFDTTDILVSNNYVDRDEDDTQSTDFCYSLSDTTHARFYHNTCVDVITAAFRFYENQASVHHIQLIGNDLLTTGQSALADYFIWSSSAAALNNSVIRDNRVRGQNVSESFIKNNYTSSSMNKVGNIEAISETGFRIGDDEIVDVTGSGLEVASGNLQVSSEVTKDAEWDTAAEINAATTDDDLATLTGSETIQNKTFDTTNTFPLAGIIGFKGVTAQNTYLGPNVAMENTTESAVSMRVPRIEVKDLACKVSPAPTGSQTWTMTIRDDGSDTSVSCVIDSSSGGVCQDSDAVVIADGSQLALGVTKSGIVNTTTVLCVVGTGS